MTDQTDKDVDRVAMAMWDVSDKNSTWENAGENIKDIYRRRSSAAIAALPDMIEPLVWEFVDEVTEGCTSVFGHIYTVWAMDGFGYCKFPSTPAGERFLGGIEAAKAAANAHHRAQIMGAFGVTL